MINEFDSFGVGFSGFSVMFFIFFALFICVFVAIIIKGIMQWNKNNHSPRLTVDATLVSKRMDVSHHHHSGAGGAGTHTTSSTSYFATFEVESGDRMELQVNGSEYGMLVEGDYGRLTFQGTRYLGFERS